MIPPREKAIELRFRYWRSVDVDGIEAKKCALIAIDEMIEWSKQWVDEELLAPALIYLENVKKEMDNI